MKTQTSIIVVGGGFAGTTVARRLTGRLPADVTLTLVSEESCTTFNPMLCAIEITLLHLLNQAGAALGDDIYFSGITF